MAISVMLAGNPDERSLAHQLVRAAYLKAFKLDINELSKVRRSHFESDVLIAFDPEDRKILGTMSVMYPDLDGLFPCESLFGFDLADYSLSARKYVEIGRFATSDEGKKNAAVVISLFLGALKRLRSAGIDGWVATVKDDVYGFLEKLSLPFHSINQIPRLADDDLLKNYTDGGSALHLFDVSLTDTACSFQRFDRYLDRGRITLMF